MFKEHFVNVEINVPVGFRLYNTYTFLRQLFTNDKVLNRRLVYGAMMT